MRGFSLVDRNIRERERVQCNTKCTHFLAIEYSVETWCMCLCGLHPTGYTFSSGASAILAKYCRSSTSPFRLFSYRFSILVRSVRHCCFEAIWDSSSTAIFTSFRIVFIQIKYRWDNSRRFHSKCSSHPTTTLNRTFASVARSLRGTYFTRDWKKILWSSLSLLFISTVNVRQI